jgi:DNA primase
VGLIPDDKIAEIRDRTDIVQVIGEYVSLRRAGTNWKGLCPFHNEKSPSFNVHPVRQFFHCFGCGKSGDVFSFLRELEGKSFIETARDLARKAGIDLPEPTTRSPEAQAFEAAQKSERQKMLALNEMVAGFFARELAGPQGAQARAYLEKRGIAGAKRKEGAEEALVTDVFHVGYAPAGWEALVRFLEEKKVPHELAERAGLIRQRDRHSSDRVPARPQPGSPPTKATHFDVFVDRVVYALTSPVGEILGFGGRIMDPPPGTPPREDGKTQPKYKNSPETLLYKKGDNLFGLHAARHQIRRSGRALVVEGNFDVMTLHAVGVGYAVAPQGTAITVEQVKLLSRFAREVVLMLDADPAGRAATMKVIHLFVEAGLPCRIASLRPETRADGSVKKVDPDELARRDLPRLQALIDSAPDAVEHFFNEVASSADPTVPGRVRAIGECVPLLRAVPDRLARELYCEQLAQLLKVPTGKVIGAMREMNARPPSRTDIQIGRRDRDEGSVHPSSPSSPSSPEEIVSREPTPREISPVLHKLLSLLAQHAALLPKLPIDLVAAIDDEAVRTLLEGGMARRALDSRAVESAGPEIRQAAARALLSDEFAGIPNPEKALASIAAQIKIPRDRTGLEEARKAALESGDKELVRTINARILASTRS